MSEENEIDFSEIRPDLHNANRHTIRGEATVRESMRRYGFAEAGTLDKHGRLISGNLRTEVAAEVLDPQKAIVIDVDGNVPVYIRRKDLDLDDPETKALAVSLNRTAQVSIDFDPDMIAELHEMNLVDWLFTESEVNALTSEDEGDTTLDLSGLGEDSYDQDEPVTLTVVVTNESVDAVIEFLDELPGVQWRRHD